MGAVENEAVGIFKRVAALPKIEIHSISTHMPVSDVDADYTRDELVRFRKIVEQLRAAVPGNYKAHVLQSAGTLAFNETPYEIVRAGLEAVVAETEADEVIVAAAIHDHQARLRSYELLAELSSA